MKNNFQKRKKELQGLKENVPLKKFTTFKIGGPAKYFFVAKSVKDIIKAKKWAEELNVPVFFLGEGSNVLVSDKGYNALVVKIEMADYKIKKEKIFAEAGIKVSTLAEQAEKRSFAGLEWASGIPGTVGAAVYGNIGAFGSTIANNVEWVKALDLKSLKIKKIFNKQCGFKNKESVFKKNKNLVILSVLLKLKKGDKKEIKKEIKRFLDYRKQNHPLEYPSAGCIFKNYDKKISDKKLLKKYPELIEFNKGSRIPTSYLIDKSGLKGMEMGKAKVSDKHANFIVNLGGAKAKDVVKLIKMIKQKVKSKFGIELEEEIQYLGF